MSNEQLDYSFLGRGWSFPVRFKTQECAVEMVGGIEDIEQSLKLLLETLPGERRTLLEYGCKVRELIFDPIDSQFPVLIEEAIRNAIESFEPRIEVSQVRQSTDSENPNLVLIDITYTVKMTNSRYNLVYPFATLEAILS